MLCQIAFGKYVFISFMLILVALHPLSAQTDEETISELNERIGRVAAEAQTNRLITGWSLTGAGAGLTIAQIASNPYPTTYGTIVSIGTGALMAVPGVLCFLIPTEAENLASEFSAFPVGTEKARALKIRVGETILETLAMHGKRDRRAGAFTWFVVAAIEIFAYTVFSGELQDDISPNDFTTESVAWFAVICATSTAGVLNLVLKSRAEIEREAYLAWRENPQSAAALTRFYDPKIRFTPTSAGFGFIVDL